VKRTLLGVGLAVWLIGVAAPVHAHDAYDDSQSHPLQLAAYALNPVGVAIEWVFTRPIHFLVSQPKLERVFGHVPHESPFGYYAPYEADSD
jgi:hypothetical protein